MLWAAKTIRKIVRTIIIISKSDIIASPPFLLWIRGAILSVGAKRPTTAYRFTGQAQIISYHMIIIFILNKGGCFVYVITIRGLVGL